MALNIEKPAIGALSGTKTVQATAANPTITQAVTQGTPAAVGAGTAQPQNRGRREPVSGPQAAAPMPRSERRGHSAPTTPTAAPAPQPGSATPPANTPQASAPGTGRFGSVVSSVLGRAKHTNGPATTPAATPVGTTPATGAPGTTPQATTPPAATGVYGSLGSDTVADRVNALLNRDNDLMKTAAQRGLDAGNKRGLLNSSISVGASIKSMIDSIVPIASQDSQQSYGEMLQTMINAHQTSMQQMQNTSQEKIAASGNSSSEKIASGNNKTATDVAAANAKAEAERQAAAIAAQKEQDAVRIAAEKELAATNAAAAKELEAMRLEFQSLANAQSLSAQDKANLTNALNNAASTYATTQSAIFTNPKMTGAARTSALMAAKDAYMAQIAMIEQQYGVSLSPGNAPSGTPAPTTPAPTTPAATPAAAPVASGAPGTTPALTSQQRAAMSIAAAQATIKPTVQVQRA